MSLGSLYVGRPGSEPTHVRGLIPEKCAKIEESVLCMGQPCVGHVPGVYMFLSGGCLCNVCLTVYVCDMCIVGSGGKMYLCVCTHVHTHMCPASHRESFFD